MESESQGSSKFWRGAFCDTDGTPSIGSVLGALCSAFVFGWGTAIVTYHIKTHYEPVIPDLTGCIALIVAVMGVHRAGNYFENKK